MFFYKKDLQNIGSVSKQECAHWDRKAYASGTLKKDPPLQDSSHLNL